MKLRGKQFSFLPTLLRFLMLLQSEELFADNSVLFFAELSKFLNFFSA